jgi:hypothetical protein
MPFLFIFECLILSVNSYQKQGEKFREIDLLNEARRPLYLYLQHGGAR